MKTSVLLSLALSFLAAGSSSAQPGKPVHHAVRHTHTTSQENRGKPRHAPAHHFSALALEQARLKRHPAGTPPAAADDDDQVTPDPDHPGWLKDKDHAGWGVTDGSSQTVMGVYKRPVGPQLPGPDIQREGHGAAGVSVSVKLGGH